MNISKHFRIFLRKISSLRVKHYFCFTPPKKFSHKFPCVIHPSLRQLFFPNSTFFHFSDYSAFMVFSSMSTWCVKSDLAFTKRKVCPIREHMWELCKIKKTITVLITIWTISLYAIIMYDFLCLFSNTTQMLNTQKWLYHPRLYSQYFIHSLP